MNESATLTIPEFMSLYKLGRTRTYEEIESGNLVTYRVGRNRYVSTRAAQDWQNRLEAEARQTADMAGA